MTNWAEHSRGVIEQFRANGGKVKGYGKLILLTTTGAKSGQPRTAPLMYIPDGDRFLAIGSKGAEPTNPGWYYNLLAHPDAIVELGNENYEVTARVLTGDEREEAFAKAVALFSFYAGYRKKAKREIPVIALEKRSRS